MNNLIWNCRGTLKPKFKQTFSDLVRWHRSIILVIMETKISGNKAKEVIKSLPFDGYIFTDTIY